MAGKLGVKSGEGFYAYTAGSKELVVSERFKWYPQVDDKITGILLIHFLFTNPKHMNRKYWETMAPKYDDEIFDAKREKDLKQLDTEQEEIFGRASSFRKGPIFEVELDKED